MSNCNCNSLSCNRVGPWVSCGGNCGCNSCGSVLGSSTCCNNCGCSNCGCVASDGTPACNPWAPWGRAGDFSCRWNRFGRWDRWGCNRCNSCNSCDSCGNVAGDSICDSCGSCNSCGCSTCGCDSCGNVGSSGGCLVPRIISTGRTFQRRITQTLCVDDLPDCAESPLTLVSVTVSGQASWEQISECRQTLLRVTVPVVVQIRDCSGRCRTGHSTVTLTIPLCMNCPAQDFWRGQLFVAPCIRLAASVTEDEDGCFDAPLEVQAEVFLVRMQVVNC